MYPHGVQNWMGCMLWGSRSFLHLTPLMLARKVQSWTQPHSGKHVQV